MSERVSIIGGSADGIEDQAGYHAFSTQYLLRISWETCVSRTIIRELINEAEGSLKMNYLTGASACMRKAIYELLVYEKIEGDSYKDRINSLKGLYSLIDPELFDVLGHIQQMTSDKVHEQTWDKWNSPTLRLIIGNPEDSSLRNLRPSRREEKEQE